MIDINEMRMMLCQEILLQPFALEDLSYRPQSKGDGQKKRVLTYLTSRDVMDRLDLAFGPSNWENHFDILPDHRGIVCHLRCVWPNGVSTTRCDVGAESEQPDDGDKSKAAFSDALKRAAVLYGIGRYLYDLKNVYAEIQNGRVIDSTVTGIEHTKPVWKNLKARVQVYRLALNTLYKTEFKLPSPSKYLAMPENEYLELQKEIVSKAKSV